MLRTLLLIVATSVSAFHVQAPLQSAHSRAVARRPVAPRMDLDVAAATTWLVAADDGGFNPLFLVLPVPWVVGLGYVAYQAKATTARRNDPANECRLGYSVKELDNMEELARLRLQSDIKDYEEACEKAEAAGAPKPNGLSWLANKQPAKGDYFGGGKNESPTMI